VLQGKGNTVSEDTLRPLARALGLRWETVRSAELASRQVGWELPPRAQSLSPAGRKALTAHLDLLLDLEAKYRRR
jgi:hypothetical protein